MISVRRAFTGHTTTPVLFQKRLEGGYDKDNVWREGEFSKPHTIHVTPLPYGNREDGILGDQLKPTITGERTPSYMQIHSPTEIAINSYLTIYGQVYKIIRKGNYTAAGYWSTLGEGIQGKTLGTSHKATKEGIIKRDAEGH